MSIPQSELHKAARAFAEAGIRVFPCQEDGKAPACANGFHDATTDLGQIDEWWNANPNFNVAFSPEHAGWCVVDIDPGASPEDIAALSLPDSYTVETPRGGKHIYLAGSLPSSAGKLAAHIDTRGAGGYVLAPPSIVNGKPYKVQHDTDIAPAPDGLQARLGNRASQIASAIGRADLDLPANVGRARSALAGYVRARDVAIEGQGGNHRTYRLACEIQNLGLTQETALDIIDEIWNPHCIPPWDRDELGVIIEHASRYAQNEAGAWAVEPAAQAFSSEALDRIAAEAPRARRSRFYPEDDEEMDQTPAARWLYPNIMQDASTVMIYGKTQSFKSFLAIAFALGAATGKETLGFKPALMGPTFYGALEGRADIKRKRRISWRLAHEVEGKTDFYVLPAPMLVFDEEVQEFGDQITARLAGRKPRMIVLDTVSKMMVGLDPTRDAPRLIRFCDSLVETFGCTVVAIHHTGHDEKRGPRDSSAYHSGFDTVLEVKGDHRAKISSLTVLKHKDSDEPAEPFHFQGKPVGQSLVFFPITADQHREITAQEDAFDPRKIGKALQNFNSYGREQAVSTLVLAGELVPALETDTQEARDLALRAASRRLNTLAKDRLAGYCDGTGADRVWFLPNRPAE